MVDTNRVSVALLRPVAQLLGHLGIEPDGFLRDLGVDADSAPNTYVSGRDVDRRFAEIAARIGDPTLGLTLAELSLAKPIGLFGHMVWLSGTVRDALQRAVKFYAMVSRRVTLALDDDGPIAYLRQHPTGGVRHGATLTELAFGSVAMRARAATDGRFAVRAVRFAHPAPARLDAYARVFGAPATFDAPHDELACDASQLDLPLASADPITSAALEAKVAQLTATDTSPLVDRVRRAVAGLLQAPQAPIAVGVVAGALGISARTLRRHLEQERQSLRAIVDDVRRERADELRAAGWAMKEIAFHLGFSEPSALSRAYKRWTAKAGGARVK